MKVLIFLFVICCFQIGFAQDDPIGNLLNKAKYYEQFGEDSLGNQLYYYITAHQKLGNYVTDERWRTTAMQIGGIYEKRDLYENALEYYLPLADESIDLEMSLADRHYLLGKIGTCYSEIGKPEVAFKYFDEVFQQADYSQQIDVLRNIVEAYYKNNQFDKALAYNRKIKNLLELNSSNQEQLTMVNNNLGYTFGLLGDFNSSIEYLKQAEADSRQKSQLVQLPILINLGVTYYNLGDYDQSAKYLLKSLQKTKSESTKAEINQILATAYYKQNDLYNALIYSNKAQTLAENSGNSSLLSDVLLAKARIFSDQFEYDEALQYYQAHFALRDSLALDDQRKKQELLQFQKKLQNVNRELDSLQRETRNQQLAFDNLRLDSIRQRNDLVQLRQNQLIQTTTIKNQQLEVASRRQEIELINQQLQTVENEKQLAILEQNRQEQELELEKQQALLQEEQAGKALLQKDNEINALALQKQSRFRNNLIIISALLALLLFGMFYFYRNKRKDLKRLGVAYSDLEVTQKDLVMAEKQIKDLLKQQVSGAVATALIDGTDTNSVQQRFVALMFLDIRDFTKYAETRNPEEIIKYQNDVFGFMMEIVEKNHGVVNQLMGDGFMATFGVPISSGNDCLNAFNAATFILKKLEDKVRNQEIDMTKVGIGLHAGLVVTGNVGYEQRMQYSITGNPVIISARLEQLNKQLGSTMVFSKDLYDKLPKERQTPFEFQDVMVKGRSEPITIAAINQESIQILFNNNPNDFSINIK